ncbi:MAG TPA: eL32 family ribosomal protein [Acidobacteriota bacterium]|nr:eL32 family ribosomal protein [Acidobacteriota bacterium]
MTNLLKEKEQIRKIRPVFRRHRANQIKRISRTGYRAGKGLHNKMGDNKAGHRPGIATGYGYPKDLRGFDRKGRKIVHIESVAAVANANAKTDVAVISAKLGTFKKIQVVQALIAKQVPIANVKDAQAFVTAATKGKQEQKHYKEQIHQARLQKKQNAAAAAEKKSEKKEEKAAKAESKADVAKTETVKAEAKSEKTEAKSEPKAKKPAKKE